MRTPVIYDYRLPNPPAWPDDITYCYSECCTLCWRHHSKIDWQTAKHKYYGASMADFSLVCASYEPMAKCGDME